MPLKKTFISFEVVGHGHAPASVQDDIVLHAGEVRRREWSAVIAAHRDRGLRHVKVFIQVQAGLERPGEEGEPGDGGSGADEAVADVVDGEEEGVLRPGLLEELQYAVAFAAREVDRRGLIRVGFQAALGREVTRPDFSLQF